MVMVITRGREVGEMERRWLKDTKLQLFGMSKSTDLIDSTMTTVNNIVLNIGKFIKRFQALSLYTHTEVIM